MIIGDGIMLGAGGETASIFVTGLSETDSVTATHKIPGKVPNPAYRNLPEGYTQLEYIKNSGTQVLDTGIAFTNNHKIEVKVNSELYTDDWIGFVNSGSNLFRFSGKTIQWGSTDGTLSVLNDGVNVVSASKTNVIVNGATYTNSYTIPSNTTTLCLFGTNRTSEPVGYYSTSCIYEIYYAKIWDGETLVRDFIPAKRNSDGAVGLYDLVSNTFFSNSGTGSFTAGAEIPQYIDGYVDGKTIIGKWTQKPNPAIVVPDGYTQLEYIQSSGTQYIDTGIIGKSGIEAETKLMWLSAIDDQSALGARTGSTRIYPVDLDSGKWSLGYSGNNVSSVAPVQNKIYDVYSKLYAGSQILKVDGATILNLSNSSSYNTNRNLWMPSTNYDGSYAQSSSVRIYFMRIKMDGVLVRNFIPCKRMSDGAIGMYDLATNAFFGNSGTGTFTAGAEIPQTIDGFLIDKIKSYGTWTVTATNGTKTATETVLVDSAKQYVISLSFSLVLYVGTNSGEDYYSVDWQYKRDYPSGDYPRFTYSEASMYGSATDSPDASRYVQFAELIDCSLYNSIKYLVVLNNTTSTETVCELYSTYSSEYDSSRLFSYSVKPNSSTAEQIVTFDISDVAERGYLAVRTKMNGCQIRKVWLE